MMKYDNPKNWKCMFDIVRKGETIEVWLPPVDSPEGELIISCLHSDYIPSLIAALNQFEQKEGR